MKKMTISALTLSGGQKDISIEKFRMRVSGYALVIHQGKILLINTITTGKWFVPGGEVELGEQIEEAVKREVFEEAGIQIEVEKYVTFKETFFYYDPLDEAYQNYAMFFRCRPLTFNLTSKNNVAGDESDKPTWVDINTLQEDDFQAGVFDILKLL